MLRHRAQVAGALVMVALTSGSLGVGLLGAKPVMEAILGQGRGMDTLARAANEWLAREITPDIAIPDRVIAQLPTEPFATLAWLMVGLCALALFGAVCNFGHAFLAHGVVNRTATRVRHEAFRSLVRGSLRDLWAMGGADAVSRVVNDSNALASGLTVLLSKAVLQVSKGIAGLAAAVFFDWRVTAAALLVAPGLYGVIRTVGRRIKRGSRAALTSQASLYSAAAEVAGALRVVKVSTSEAREIARFHQANKAMLRELNRVRAAKALASPLTEMLAIFLLCALVLLAGKVILARSLDPGDFILALGSLAVAGASLKPITGIINEIQAASPAAARLHDLIVRPREGAARGNPALPRHGRDLVFDRVDFTYSANQPAPTNPPTPATSAASPTTATPAPLARPAALRAISLTIPHGQRFALVGPNGSGKTTLTSLVPRLFDPDKGRVLIDGVDIRTVSLRSLRRQIAVVTQEVVLFGGTIASNIAYGLWASRADIERAARLARCHDFIAALPSGYDTPIGEGGLGLSGGQRQRIAIARAVLRDPSILILDEATSMIDPESEGAIASALAEFCVGRTCLIVAHRLRTVRSCDAIVVLRDGSIEDVGTHDQLLQRCALYQSLARDGLG
jgi:ABC-type multidrug transport system fused ATPase/permease subunit